MAKPEGIARAQDGGVIQALALGAVSEIDYLVSSVQSGAVMGGTVLRVVPTTDCYVEVGSNPTATASGSSLFPAMVAEYIMVKDEDKLAAIRKTADGTLNITVIL